ncbi:MAG: amidohydrolase family protein [Bacteroidaceae bacterium]|nr:amidohydrolase family protein [Bacteroidaceae bacterium]
MKKIYKAHILYTKEQNRFEVLENGYIVVEDGCVVDISTDLSALKCSDAEVTDFGNRLLIPAMNDLHVHAPQYRNQGIAMDLELLPWLQNYTFPEEMKYADTAYAERMYRRFVRDLWRFGTMRASVFATIHTESTRLLMHLFQEAGMGALVGKVGMDACCPPKLRESVEEMVKGYESLIMDDGQPTGNHQFPPLVQPIITPRFIPSCTPEMLRACGQLAAKYHLPVQSHLSENKDEIALVRELEPNSTCYGDAYNQYGLFGQTPTVMAHCVWTEGEELELMKRNGVVVAHCPTSNFNVASGMAPIRRFLDEGLHVGLGSDISGGHDLSIFQVMVYAIQVSKMYYQQNHECPFLTLSEAFWLATKSAGSFFGHVGSFEPGYEFDALVIDDSDLNHDNYTLLERLERYIYLGDDRQIVHRFCRGNEIAEPEVS